jgi:hypothetical protein
MENGFQLFAFCICMSYKHRSMLFLIFTYLICVHTNCKYKPTTRFKIETRRTRDVQFMHM